MWPEVPLWKTSASDIVNEQASDATVCICHYMEDLILMRLADVA